MTLEMVAYVLIILAAADVAVTFILVRAARQSHETALEERASASVVLTVAALIMAGLSAAYLLDVVIPDPYATGLLVCGIVLISAPQLIWAVSYWRGAFR